MKFILLSLTLFILAFPSFSSTIKLEKGDFVVLDKAFDQSSTARIMSEVNDILYNPILTKRKIIPFTRKKRTIYLILDTPGGGVMAGLKMFDYLNSLENVEIKTITLFAASMGFHAAQFLGERLITPSGTLMTHKARGGFKGEFQAGNSQIDSRYKYWLRRIKRMDERTIKRTNGKMNLKEYRNLMENEYWCEGKDCVDKGFADKVVNVVCGESLSGAKTSTETYNFFGMEIKVKLNISDCPFVGTTAVKLKFKSDVWLDLNSPLVNPEVREYVKTKLDKTNRAIK